MRRKHFIVYRLLLAAAGFLTVAAVIVGLSRLLPNRFPVWEPVRSQRVNEAVTLECRSVEYGLPAGDLLADLPDISLENTGDREISYGLGFELQYLHDGQWYTVYRTDAVPAMALTLGPGCASRAALGQWYAIPTGLLSLDGPYRLYLNDLGYCNIPLA